MVTGLLRSSTIAACALCACTSLAAGADSVQFNYQLAQVGQESAYDVHFDLRLNIEIRQGGKVVADQERGLSRDQERQITVLETTGDRATKVRVHFARAQESAALGSSAGTKQPLVIEGKSYLIERRGAELLITDDAGNEVSAEEKAIITPSMEGVGRRNQLARYLHGRTVEVGQSLELPKEMAADLLGLRDEMGDIQAVELTLRGVRAQPEGRVADFVTTVAFKRGSGQALRVEGDLQVEVDTCRIVAADFSGPVSGRQEQAHDGDAYELLTEGTLTASVRCRQLR